VRVWSAWSYLVVFGSLIGFSAYRFLVERVSSTLATTYAYVNPPVALLVVGGSAMNRFRPVFSSDCRSCSAPWRCWRGHKPVNGTSQRIPGWLLWR
jgi:hypothetical protein